MALHSVAVAMICASCWPEGCWNYLGMSKRKERTKGEKRGVPGAGRDMDILSCKVYLWSGSSIVIRKPTFSSFGISRSSDG